MGNQSWRQKDQLELQKCVAQPAQRDQKASTYTILERLLTHIIIITSSNRCKHVFHQLPSDAAPTYVTS